MTRRLLFSYLTFALLILVSLEIPLAYAHHRNEEQQAFEQLEHDAEVLAAFVDTAVDNGDPAQVEVLAHESAQRLGGHVEIVGARGELMSSTHGDAGARGSLAGEPDIRAVLSGQGRISTGMSVLDGTDVMSVAVPVHPGVVTQGALRVSVPTAAMAAQVRHFRMLLAAVGVIVLAAAALIAFALARWISRPVRALEHATRGLAEGIAPPPLPVSGPPELRRLADTFAGTADRLQVVIAAQRSFIGHASHQLKTPLAALRLRLENLEPDIAEPGGRNLRAALAETDRLAQMVETLLAMARCETTTLTRESVDLADAVAARMSAWAPLAAEQDVRLTAPDPDGTRVRAIPGAVDQIIDNLVSNALRAAPRGSTVRIQWRPVRDTDGPALVELHIVDQGAGLTADQRTRALEAFWRAPGAARDGTGLGLSLVRQLAEASGGAAALRPGDGAGIDAVVTLPAETAAA